MDISPDTRQQHVDEFDAWLAGIASEGDEQNMPYRAVSRPGMMGRLFGRTAERTSQERRLDMEASSDPAERVAVVIARRLLHMERRDVVRLLPEAIVEGALPKNDEDRFMHLAEAAAGVFRWHLAQSVARRSDDELRPFLIRSIMAAVDEDSGSTLTERLRDHLNVLLMQEASDAAIVNEDALLIEIDNVMLGEPDEQGRMAYGADLIVDGHLLASVASNSDSSIHVLEWFGDHGPEDLDAVRDHVAQWGEPRDDIYGSRPDSLEEVLLDRITTLLTKHVFIGALADDVLFCDTQEGVPGGHVIRVMPIDPDVGREATWQIVMDLYPDAILLDSLGEEDAFALWMAFSDN